MARPVPHWLDEAQQARYAQFKEYVSANVEPFADEWEREQALSKAALSQLAASGYLGASLPVEYGGKGWDIVTFGLLNEAFGRGSPSLTSVLTVQAMHAMAIVRWGTREQKSKWLPRLASGELIAAFALTEPDAGSALNTLTTRYSRDGGGQSLRLNGVKRWITCAQIADVFLVFGKLEEQPIACIVPRESPGLSVEPIRELMGFRAAGLATITFRDVEIPLANVVGKAGFGFSHVAPVGLHYGRISTACHALGMLRGCVEESVAWAARRKIGDQTVGEFGMIRTLIARMATDLQAATLLCLSACRSDDEHAAEAFEDAFTAKYFTSRAAVSAASDAVQIRGAAGCHESSPTSRYYRSSKITEIIEGTTQIHEDLLGKLILGRSAMLLKSKGGK
ncbi:MAG TPA: acyl-CoA dehydrogenase family protein [Steroidobacteraceae bacterium]|jgi:alkylation response protein AidB-like acyl-CoA dehydrogenase|nr:acyl-CoA dehydrogenase family protein [Steroidobacteraceae bacterium]